MIKLSDFLEGKLLRHWLACDAEGRAVNPESPKAAKFCIMGACMKLYDSDERFVVMCKIRQELIKRGMSFEIAKLNDYSSEEEVLSLLRSIDL